jgi:hypothetical protein
VDSQSDWFSEGVFKQIGDGILTSFWFDPWVDSVPLRIQYQYLFQIFDQCLGRVADMGNWMRGECVWEFRWRIHLCRQDQDLLNQLIESLRQVRLSTTKDDWCWRHDPSGVFSVKSAYLVLDKRDRPQRILSGNDIENLARV